MCSANGICIREHFLIAILFLLPKNNHFHWNLRSILIDDELFTIQSGKRHLINFGYKLAEKILPFLLWMCAVKRFIE